MSPSVGSPAPFDAERHIDAMAPALGLAITAEQRPGVAQFLSVAHAMSLLVAELPEGDEPGELAPTFRPGQAEGA